MAITIGDTPTDVAALLRTAPEKYTDIGTLLKYNKPDNRDLLIETYGDQGITGFLQMVGAVTNAGTADQVQYWEEGRLHKTVAHNAVAAGASDGAEAAVTTTADGDTLVRLNDVLLLNDKQRVVVTSTGVNTFGVRRLDGGTVAAIAGTGHTAVIIGNIYGQGTGQPTNYYETDVTKRTNDFFITKETFAVNGSQATNIGWINVGNGDYRWYVKGEMDARKRFLNQREMMMMLSEVVGTGNNVTLPSATSTTGSEGYFSAIEDRGINASGTFQGAPALAEFDKILLELDAQGAPSEYAMYVNLATSLDIDDMLASGVSTGVTAGLAGQFGAFNNDSDMAAQLGFKSFTRGGYTFHKHDWKLLNDPTLLGAAGMDFLGVMTPMSKVADAKTGAKAHALEINYKEANGYSREVEHWVEGGGVLGFATNDEDVAKFHYRSEACLITRAANQHVLLTA